MCFNNIFCNLFLNFCFIVFSFLLVVLFFLCACIGRRIVEATCRQILVAVLLKMATKLELDSALIPQLKQLHSFFSTVAATRQELSIDSSDCSSKCEAEVSVAVELAVKEGSARTLKEEADVGWTDACKELNFLSYAPFHHWKQVVITLCLPKSCFIKAASSGWGARSFADYQLELSQCLKHYKCHLFNFFVGCELKLKPAKQKLCSALQLLQRFRIPMVVSMGPLFPARPAGKLKLL
jgi:hypothetical protein